MYHVCDLLCIQIKKEDVDDYRPGQGIPSCHLLAQIVDRSTIEPLQHAITLDGAEPPNTFFTIYIDPGMPHCYIIFKIAAQWFTILNFCHCRYAEL